MHINRNDLMDDENPRLRGKWRKMGIYEYENRLICVVALSLLLDQRKPLIFFLSLP